MELVLSSPCVKIFDESDVVPIACDKCLKNQSYAFQVLVKANKSGRYAVSVDSDLICTVSVVKSLKGDYYYDKGVDDFYVYSVDGYYPELLQSVERLDMKAGELKVLYVAVSEKEKSSGKHKIKVCVGDKSIDTILDVVDCDAVSSDLKITHWTHLDGICRIYNVEPFSDAFYKIFDKFMTAYVRLGNTMALVPLFTPPLDTVVGGERLTVQSVKVKKVGLKYVFDLTELGRYIDFCLAHGIKYFELSHLFTQWGGKFCPKIVAEIGDEKRNIFGWKVKSTSLKYKRFLKAFFAELIPFLKEKGVFENTVMHLTDEPNGPHIKRYVRLSKFVKKYNGGIPIFDALSHYDFYKSGAVDIPSVSIGSNEYDLFDKRKILVYYCCCEHKNYLTNRFFHMPLIRTEVLGVCLYGENVSGFLHWGYNFYNKKLSVAPVDPYLDTTAGENGFPAGDGFLVYPGENNVEYSIRYHSIMRAFEDYRLLKTLETKIGRTSVIEILEGAGYRSMHEYPHDADWLEKLRSKVYGILTDFKGEQNDFVRG